MLPPSLPYVDVHCHLIHPRFLAEEDAAVERAVAAGLEFVIVNGLEPVSNREVLTLCARHPNLLAAVGIYPVDACAAQLDHSTWQHPFDPPTRFDVDAEIDWIDAVADQIIAIGECGLDAHWVKDDVALAEQERVLRRLCKVAIKHDLPMILHTRKAEARTLAVLLDEGVTRADFHCYGGKLKLAKRVAEAGYHLSIPPVVERSDAFQRLAQELPLDRILTETDSPYMGPDRGERNEPANVPRGVAAIAAARQQPVDVVANAIRTNFRTLFGR